MVKSFYRTLFLIGFLFFSCIQINAQVNLVVNPGFEEYDYFETELTHLPFYAAIGWKGFRTPDLYLRPGVDKNENIVRVAPYLNESVIGSLKYPTQKNKVYHFSMEVFSFKKRKQNNLFQLCFLKNLEEGFKEPQFVCNCMDIPSKKIKKGWQTIELKFYVQEDMNNFLLGNIKDVEDEFVIYIDNIKITTPKEEFDGTLQIED